MEWALISTAFLQGLLGSTHCIGMCGPFVAILQTREGAGIPSNFVYNLGRSISYSTVGMVLGVLGWGANRFLLADIAGWAGGILILVLGFGYIFPIIPGLKNPSAPAFVVQWSAQALKRIQSANLLSFLMGLVSGLLPCGLLYPAYGLALLSGDWIIGGVVMLSFSLGTYPMLFSLGLAGKKIMHYLRNSYYRILVGVLLILLGIFTIYNRAGKNLEEENCGLNTIHREFAISKTGS